MPLWRRWWFWLAMSPLIVVAGLYVALVVFLNSCGSDYIVTATWKQPDLYDRIPGNSTGWESAAVRDALEGQQVPESSLRIARVEWEPESASGPVRFEYRGPSARVDGEPAKVTVESRDAVSSEDLSSMAHNFVARLGAGDNTSAIVFELLRTYQPCSTCYGSGGRRSDGHSATASFPGYADMDRFFEGLVPTGVARFTWEQPICVKVCEPGAYVYARERRFGEWTVHWTIGIHDLQETVNRTEVTVYASPIRVRVVAQGGLGEKGTLTIEEAQQAIEATFSKHGLPAPTDLPFERPCNLM